MAGRKGISAIAELEAAGRFGDTRLAHFSPDELAILDHWQGGRSINPKTGLPEYFKLKKILKSVAKAGAALAGSYLGGPVGAAIGGGLASKLLGDSTQNALMTGALSGLGAFGVQQSGIGDKLGIDALSSGTDLLGRAGADAASSGGGMGMSALLPILGLTAAGAASAPKAPKAKSAPAPDQGEDLYQYEDMNRGRETPTEDPYSYGVFGPEFQYFTDVNPDLQRINMRQGGRVRMAAGGASLGGLSGDRGEASKRDREKAEAARGNRGGSDRSASVTGNRFGAPSPSATAAKTARDAAVTSRSRPGGNATTADKMIMDRYINTPAEEIDNEADYWKGVGNLGKASNDEMNRGQGFSADPLGAIARGLGSIFGIGEVDPLSQPLGARVNNPNASWGVDPVGAVLGAGGLAGVVPFGLGSLWSGFKHLSGYQGPMYSFDGYQPISQDESASNYHWSDSGAMSGYANKLNSLAAEYGIDLGGNGAAGGGTGPNGESRGLPYYDRPPKPTGGSRPQQAAPTPGPDEQTDTGGVSDVNGRVYMPLGDPYSYGQFGPEHNFFTGQLVPQDLNMARGGGVKGPGTGQSDDIPAMLSDGEHVIDAETVSMLGDGSNDAGHKKIEQFKKNVRKHKRKANPTKIPPKSKGISAYLRRAA